MNIESIIDREYGICVDEFQKIKNVYKIRSGSKFYCFKIIKYEYGHFLFIHSAMRHLQNRGFEYVPEFILTKDGKSFIWVGDRRAYLTDWVIAREANYDNPIDLKISAHKLADLHIKSQGFVVTDEMKPRVGFKRWIEIFQTRRDEILDFKRRIEAKDKRTEFDEFYISFMEDELNRATKSIEGLKRSEYFSIMDKHMEKQGFCHHDYAHHNVLINKEGKVNIIDFDYCMLDTHLHDLSSLLIRTMKNGQWDIKTCEYIISNYNEINKVNLEDIPLMMYFMNFPQAYWQTGIQYYWEKQPWGEEFFMKKIEKIHEDREYRDEFLEEFKKKEWSVVI